MNDPTIFLKYKRGTSDLKKKLPEGFGHNLTQQKGYWHFVIAALV